MELTVDAAEITLLRQVLADYVSDLRMEIAGTEDYGLRQELKRNETIARRLISQLPRGEQAGPAVA